MCFDLPNSNPFLDLVLNRSTLTNLQIIQGLRTFLVSEEVLDDDVSHVVSVGVAVFVQAMYSAEHQLVVG